MVLPSAFLFKYKKTIIFLAARMTCAIYVKIQWLSCGYRVATVWLPRERLVAHGVLNVAGTCFAFRFKGDFIFFVCSFREAMGA